MSAHGGISIAEELLELIEKECRLDLFQRIEVRRLVEQAISDAWEAGVAAVVVRSGGIASLH